MVSPELQVALSRQVYTYYAVAESVICDSLHTGLKPLKRHIIGLSSQGFRFVICAFAVDYILVKLWVDPEHTEYWTEAARASCIMSGIDGSALEHYLEDWNLCFAGMEEIEDNADGILRFPDTHHSGGSRSSKKGLPDTHQLGVWRSG